jgi:mannose-1-phosphate guanylyltransferase
MTTNFHAVILAGGKGMRLWPASRLKHPKQFLSLEPGGQSLLQITAERLLGLVDGWDKIWVVTTSAFAEKVKQLLPSLPERNLLEEPQGRNTSPAIALALIEIKKRHGDDAVAGIFQADHSIRGTIEFYRAIHLACKVAVERRAIVTIGLPARFPSTDLGYIEVGEVIQTYESLSARAVSAFLEKPDIRKAEECVVSGKFFWNSGIFILRAEDGLHEFNRNTPNILKVLDSNNRDYLQITDTSFERSILEKCAHAVVVSADFEWSDIGDWPSLATLLASECLDRQATNFLLLDADGTRLLSNDNDELVVVVGVPNVIVVRNGNVTVVIAKDSLSALPEIRERVASESGGDRFL